MDAEDNAYCVNVDEASTFSSRVRHVGPQPFLEILLLPGEREQEA